MGILGSKGRTSWIVVSLVSIAGCIVQTGTRPAAIEDSAASGADAETADTDVSEGRVDAGSSDAGETVDAGAASETLDDADVAVAPDGKEVPPTCDPLDPTSCDDADECTVDSCVGQGDCTHVAVDCQDGVPCTDDSCSPAQGCAHEPNAKLCGDGEPCTLDTCDPASGCSHESSDGPCDDDDDCTVGDACAGGVCQAGKEVLCDDWNPCTDEVCLRVGGCVTVPNATACADGNPCTVGDTCADGACMAGPVATCDDGNPCTDDACADGCVHQPNAAVCDDGESCTAGDTCAGGSCAGALIDCDDGDPCTQGDACVNGGCVAGAPMQCDDDNPCTVGDACVAGECAPGVPKICPNLDENPCTAEGCAPETGKCASMPKDGASCDSGGGPDSGTCAETTCIEAKCGEPGHETECPLLPGYGRSCKGFACRYTRLEHSEPWQTHDVWLWVPPGSFTMGSPDLHEGQPDERPAHVVTLTYGFFVRESEVTVAEYQTCELEGGCTAPSTGANVDAHWPQNGLGRQQAEDACAWLGGRLPTEAEWEYAANGPGQHRLYPWGEGEPTCAPGSGTAVFKSDPGTAGCLEGATMSTGSMPAGASPTGAVDMAGNVAEWVADCYHGSFHGAPTDGNAWEAGCGNFGVARGGSYQSGAADIRTASRAPRTVAPGAVDLGARCVRTLEPMCGGLTCPHIKGYSATCNDTDHCEYRRVEQTEAWHEWDQWILVPPGSFPMGATESEANAAGEGPVHTVTFAEGYLIAKFEATVGQYEACIWAETCTAASTEGWDPGWGVSTSDNGRTDHPQNGLSMQQARTYCGWTSPGARLPSESEWEYAAVGGVHRKYPWGDAPEPSCAGKTTVFAEFDAPASHGCGTGGTFAVGSTPAGASAVGALDMAGNVREWVADCHHTDYGNAPTDGAAWVRDCVDAHFMRRGGSFGNVAADVRSSARNWASPGGHDADMGVRCVRPLPRTCGTTACPVLDGHEVSCNVANHCEYRRFAQTESWHEWDVWNYVPPGSLMMGSPDSEDGHTAVEAPLHAVSVERGFLIARHEIVVSQYESCMKSGECTVGSTEDWDAFGWGLNTSNDDDPLSDRSDHPQNGLTWHQSKTYCSWTAPSGRLPTEAEWEYAATGASHRKYPWGDAPPPTCSNDTAVYNEAGGTAGYGCSTGGTQAVGSKVAGASAVGGLDMAGNVWEWVEDCWHASFTGAPSDGSAWTADCGADSPRVIRGGAFDSTAPMLRTAKRSNDVPDARDVIKGARCARDICLADADCDDGEDLTCDACRAGVCHHDACMVEVPAGPFWMGCNGALDDDCNGNESPYHLVTLDAYRIDETEVTADSYALCVHAGVCSPADTAGPCSGLKPAHGRHPVSCVDWAQASTYCAWVGKRLPTEAEWEKAARGTDGRKYPWGNETPSCAYAVMDDIAGGGDGCGAGPTWPAGSKPAGTSPYGALDMAGNVWEWTADWYGEYPSEAVTNPQGPGSGTYRVVRGGSFLSAASSLRVSYRLDNVADSTMSNNLGFRCCGPPL